MDTFVDTVKKQEFEALDFFINEEKKTQRRHEERVRENHGVNRLQKHEKDVILVADPKAGKNAEGKKSSDGKPKLEEPTKDWSGFNGGDDDTPGLISLMGKVLALQAKTNSNFWSIMWKQSNESMMIQVKFAPVIGNAIKNQYDAQSNATKAQASQSLQEGIINLTMFGISLGIAAFQEFREPLEETSTDSSKGFEVDEENIAKKSESVEMDTFKDTNKLIDDEDASYAQRAKKTGKVGMSLSTKVQKRFAGLIMKTMSTAQAMSMLSQGSTGLIASKYQGKIAVQQGEEGKAAALSKEAEQFAQFYGQVFSQDEDLRQGASQNLDFTMNILKSAADTITQTVTSMFRG